MYATDQSKSKTTSCLTVILLLLSMSMSFLTLAGEEAEQRPPLPFEVQLWFPSLDIDQLPTLISMQPQCVSHE